jgi:hypothetical protein
MSSDLAHFRKKTGELRKNTSRHAFITRVDVFFTDGSPQTTGEEGIMWTFFALTPFLAYAGYAVLMSFNAARRRQRLEREYETACGQISRGIAPTVISDLRSEAEEPELAATIRATVGLKNGLAALGGSRASGAGRASTT